VPQLPRRALGAAVAAAACLTAVAAPTAATAKAPTADVLLNLRHDARLHRFVADVSNPASKRYRHYLTIEQMVKRFGATTATKRAALRWLRDQGLTGHVSVTGTAVTATTTPAVARRLFGAGGRGATTASARPRVPAALRGAVTGVAVSAHQPRAHAAQAPANPAVFPILGGSMTQRTGTPAGCAAGQSAGYPAPYNGITPNQYLTAYGHASLHARGLQGQGQRVALIEYGGFNPSDVATFAACFGLTVPPIVVHPVQTGPLPAQDETTLDLEVLAAAVPKARSIDIWQGGASPSQIFATVQASLSDPKLRADVMSISLGECEPDYSINLAYLQATNELFAFAAGSGMSVLASAGDQGSSACARANPDGSTGALPQLTVGFPASSPYVTGVGGTNIALDAGNQLVAQTTWNDAPAAFFATGGGESLLFERPAWQVKAVGADTATNNTTRVVPDLAALADIVPGYAIYCTAPGCANPNEPSGGWIAVGGTSAASPLTAGAVALANQAAAKAGQPPLGQINPLLYALGDKTSTWKAVFSDVVTGSNDLGTLIPASAYGGNPLNCCPAIKGYDPVTGWGSLKVAAFNRAALAAGRRTAKK
jgi:subtilase family serine protease